MFVKKRVIDIDVKPIGLETENPLTDSRKHETKYLDGSTEVLTANTI